MELIIKENIKEILNLDEEREYDNIKCFQYINDYGKYNFYVFSCHYDLEEELKIHYKSVNDIIAFEFQRKLMLDVEKWNLYIFFFINEKISEELKTLIEQNKYATRKIVYDNISKELSNDEIKEVILNKLFLLDLSPEDLSNTENDSTLQEIISNKDLLLINLIKEVKEVKGTSNKEINIKKKEFVQKYLEVKMHD
ncbi:ABC-three component system middle component 1 [Bacillus mycoides]|uniref:ABC-three component system middle component 1 n=1 Tax=Bacillus mycoides TaxID=1405 RepID=UPI001C03818C|nr:ABC-three component system middle component 1 [Bacillus mycoides]QWG36728.1 hypothetical protein EXW30_28460 [Bacillus mycoides]